MRYILEHPDEMLAFFGRHLWLTGVSLGIAAVLALPLGVVAARRPRIRGPLLGILGIIYTIPSLALFVLLIPIMGLGFWPAVTALAAYAQVILVRNIVVGLAGLDHAVLEAATGMGMSPGQCLWRIELPLALPVILAGVRIALLAIIGIGTIAAFINAGGLGTLLFLGVAQSNPDKIFAGAIGVSVLAWVANGLARVVEERARRRAHGGID